MFFKNSLNKIKLFSILVHFICLNEYAQLNITKNINAININSKSGLPTNYVNCVFKDQYGFYWIGTQAGLCKYDGYKVYLFKDNPKDSFSLKCSNILSISEYKQYVIIGCENGLSFYNYYTNKFTRNNKLDSIIGSSNVYNTYYMNNKLYIASSNGFFEYNFKDSTIIKYTVKENNDTLKYQFTSDSKIFYNSNHFLILDTELGIKKIDTTQHLIYDNIDYFNKQPRDIVQYGNSIYVVYSSYGIVKSDAFTLEKTSDVLLFKNVFQSDIAGQQSITQVKNNIYIGHKDGIIEFNPLTAQYKLLILNEISNIQIKKLFNMDNNLIATTSSNGVFIIPYSAQKIFNPIPEYVNSQFTNVYAITEYQTGKILIGGNEKFYIYNLLNNKIEKDYSKLFKNITILYIIPAHKPNETFIATYGKGIFQFNIETGKLKNILKNGDYLSLFLNNDDTLWAGSLQEGLWKINTTTTKFVKPKTFENRSINFIKKDKEFFWICTGGEGLYKIDITSKVFFHLNTKNKKLSNDWVYHFTEDSNYIYIATDNGLSIFNKKDSTSKFFYDADGLVSSSILSVYLDTKSNLWIGSLKGISKMILSRLNNPSLKFIYNYSYIEGLVNYEYDQNAHALLKNNYLVYGGVSGIDIFNPLKIKQSFNPIPVYVSSFKISGKDYNADTNIIFKRFFTLDWKQNNFQIELTAINPLGSDNIQYKYKLEAYDDEYSHPSNIRYISYTGLPGGTYKLKILATNQDGEWNPTPYYIYIKIIPPFWKTTWFIITASVLVFGGIFGFNQYRTYQIKKRNKELEEKVNERTKELANKNHEILSSIEYAKRIQQAILPTEKYIQTVLPNGFILYQPKDIVSGDFYWLYEIHPTENNSSVIVASVDCTGHGVPGALMSMIGNNLLNQIVIEKNITSPDKILYEMNKGVQNALKQGQSDIQTNDGMDASVIHLFKDGTLYWAGAYRPIIIIRNNGKLEKTDGDKYPIGGVQVDADRTYSLHPFQLNKADSIYLFSDGYADQFGGEKGKKMMMKRFVQLLHGIHLKPINEQKDILEKYFMQWKSSHEQVDDVLVIGIKQV